MPARIAASRKRLLAMASATAATASAGPTTPSSSAVRTLNQRASAGLASVDTASEKLSENCQIAYPAIATMMRRSRMFMASYSFPAIKPAEGPPGAAATIVVLDHQPWADALHPYPAFSFVGLLERDPTVAGESDSVVLRCHLRLKLTVMEIMRGRNGHAAFNVQPAAVDLLDLDGAARMVPGADPIRNLRRRHRRDRRQRRARQPAPGPNLFFRQRRLVIDAGERAQRLAGEHEVAGDGQGLLPASLGRRRAGFGLEIVVVGTLDEVE